MDLDADTRAEDRGIKVGEYEVEEGEIVSLDSCYKLGIICEDISSVGLSGLGHLGQMTNNDGLIVLHGKVNPFDQDEVKSA